MTQNPPSPRLEALDLAGDLEGVLLDARRLAAAAPGVHGRRRAGQGEAFWQYRDHRAEDGARLVDWRRSARGDRYFVREREREAAQTAWLWLDTDVGFNWSGDSARPSKRRRALVLSLALGVVLTRAGERIGALGRASRAGARAVDYVAHDLSAPASNLGAPRGFVLFASDFYGPIEDWRVRLQTAANAGASGALLSVSDPDEDLFPFEGRTLFRAPSGQSETIIGRAESAREAYQHRLKAQRDAIRSLGAEFGFPCIAHRTDHAPGLAFAQLIAMAEERR